MDFGFVPGAMNAQPRQVQRADKAHRIVIVKPQGEKRPARAPPVPHHKWELRRQQITKLWQLSLPRKDVLTLLKEDGFHVTKDQLWRKMDEWNLDRTAKGKGLPTSESAAGEDDYTPHSDILADISHLPSPETASSRGCVALHRLPLQHDPSAFKVGTIVAEFAPNRQSIRMWLVVAPRNASDFVNCIRVKSFGGRGIEGSLVAFNDFGTDVDDQGSKQRLIDAHALLYARGSSVVQMPAGLATKKSPLEVEVDKGLSPTVLPQKSYALFTTPRLLSCENNLALVGRLSTYSMCLAEIYYKQIFEGISGVET